MSTVSENDLREIKDLINDRFNQINEKMNERFDLINEKMNDRFDLINEKVNDIKVDIATLKEGQNSLSKRLDDTQSSINKRIDNLDFIARTVIGGVVLALLAGLAKLLYPNLAG